MNYVKISQLPQLDFSGITDNDIIPIVDIDTLTTSKATLGLLKNYFVTPFTGGTVTGDTTFTNPVLVNTLTATTIDLCSTSGTLFTGSISGCSPIQILSESIFTQGISALTLSSSTIYVDGQVIEPFTGGTITGLTDFTSGLLTNSISATTYLNLPTDVYVTGGTYSAGTATFTNTTGGTFDITGFTTGGTSGTDVFVTGGTYSAGTATFTNNTGGTFNVTGFFTGGTSGTDVFVTGGTYSAGTASFTNNTGGTFNVGGFYFVTIDSDAELFLTAGDYSLSFLESAINNLVKSFKEANLWNKFDAIYPWATDGINQTRAYQAKYNLKNPLDSDAAYRLVFSGGVTYNSTGVQFGGVNGFANTFLKPSMLPQDDVHMSIYSLSNTTGTYNDIGSQDSPLTSSLTMLILASNLFTSRTNQSTSNTATNTTSLGLYATNRTASNVVNSWRNTTKIINQTTLSTTPNNFDIYIGARNDGGTPTLFSNREYSFATIGRGLTDTEYNNMAMIIQRFMFETGRVTYRYV